MNDPRQLVLIAYCFIGLIAFALSRASPDSSSEVAAWVQGIGTLLAVGAAVWVGMLPHQREREQRRLRQVEFCRAALEVLDLFESPFRELGKAIDQADYKRCRVMVTKIEHGPGMAGFGLLLVEPRESWPTFQSLMDATSIKKAVEITAAHFATNREITNQDALTTLTFLHEVVAWRIGRLRMAMLEAVGRDSIFSGRPDIVGEKRAGD